MENEIRIEKYFSYTDNSQLDIVYDIDSIREEFEFEIEKLEKHNEKIQNREAYRDTPSMSD